MLQLRLWGFVCGSFMWQKPINHSCSLTGPLQHTLSHPHTHAHKHAWAPTRPWLRSCRHEHRGTRPAFPPNMPSGHPPHTCTSMPSNHRLIHLVRLSASPSISPHSDKCWQIAHGPSNLLVFLLPLGSRRKKNPKS